MDKKKIILIVILFVIALVLGGLLVNKKLNNNNKEEIVQSNARDENLEQLEVTNDTINIIPFFLFLIIKYINNITLINPAAINP